jgi:hypothetical protein
MVNIRKKSRLIIIAVVVIVVLVVAIPYAAYALPADDSNIAANKTLLAKGIAREVRNGEIMTSSANFTLTLERATSNNTVLRFNVVDGSIDVNGAKGPNQWNKDVQVLVIDDTNFNIQSACQLVDGTSIRNNRDYLQ